MACGSEDGRILFWDLVSGKLVHTLEGEHAVSRSFALWLSCSLTHSLSHSLSRAPSLYCVLQVRAIEERLKMPSDTFGNRAFQHRLRPVVPSE